MKIDECEREAQELELGVHLPPLVFFQRNRILALIKLIRKKDAALNKIYRYALGRIPDHREYELIDLAEEALGSELE